ncbi:hypothetical protein PR202_gb05907 [Eleusine coracana subsp. coracana]|uniref:Uncharacterized protein n=1 Tax=Eleusine coracana subsp. coracana TaxID=191504 RepID=A0AAV5E6I9_ELECO|nr:hypothetical protein PR202_gb05907 [Eleusine coracana subsp. coracana]
MLLQPPSFLATHAIIAIALECLSADTKDRDTIPCGGATLHYLQIDTWVDTEMNCHMTGSLIPPHTGSMHWLSEHDDESVSEICRFAAENFSSESMLGNINIRFEQDEQEYGSLNNINGIMNYERSRKLRKRSFEER